MKDFATVCERVGGLKGLITKLGDSPPEHKWNRFPKCPICGHKDSAGVFERGNAEFFKCHHTACSSGGRCVNEVGYINLRLGLSEDQPPAGGPSPAYKHLLELANAYEEPPKRVEPNLAEPVPAAPPPLPNPVSQPAAPVPAPAAAPAESQDDAELIRHAIEVIRQGNASIELLKRQLHLGHARAVQIMEGLERRGVVGRAIEGNKFRVILNLPPPGSPPPQKVVGVHEPGSATLGAVTDPTSPMAGAAIINGSASPAPPESSSPVPPEWPPQNPPSAPPRGAVPEKSVGKRQGKPKLEPGQAALRWFYAGLLLTSSQVRVYLPDDAPVPDALPEALLKKLEFRPVGLDEKRMLLPRSCEALGLCANPRTNEIRLLEMRALFPWDELLASGLWLEADHKRKLGRRPNPQFYGHGQVGKKPKALRRDDNDKWHWGWCEPVLIPYFNEAGELVKLRPHKGGAPGGTAAGSERIYVPRDPRTVADQPEKFSTVIICEGEFKAAVIWQSVGAGAGLDGDGQPPVGVCALPGISFARNPKYRADLEEWLRRVDCQRVLVAFDDEDKSHKPLRQRFDSVIYALYLAQWLNLEVGIPAQFIKLPEEWRVKGKADWDGGLVKLRDEKRAREAAGGVKQIFSPITESELQDCRTAIEAVMDSAIWPSQVRQLGLFTEEEEQFIFQEVDRKLWQPKLPNAGPKEREDMRRLWSLSRDESLVVILKAAAGRYADALARCLPRQECIRKGEKWVTLPGCYYKRRPVTGKTDKALLTATLELLAEATATKDQEKKWLAQYILEGLPVAVSNFRLDCLYLLRGPLSQVTRLVRLMNTKGEVSQGDQIGGADILPNEMGSGSEKFREWVQSMGNFTWGCEGGAGNTELQLLQLDVTEEAAYREVKLIEYCGWHELKVTGPRIVVPGREILHGFWICEEGLLIEPPAGMERGMILLPDDDGVCWYEGAGYAGSRKGRELDFIQGRPRLRPELTIEQVKFDTSDWEQPSGSDNDTFATSSELYATNPMGAFFRETCRRFYDTAGGLEAYLAVGAMMGYAAAPEIYAKQKNFPSAWVSGQMGSGKSTFCSWLSALHGLEVPSGMGLISKNVTAVGIACQLENYSNIVLWLDEFRQHQISSDKEPMLRDCYGRQLAGKWSPDGRQRQIRTMTLVSGESTTSDAATRSRYPHVLISEQKRRANHYDWMQKHSEYFFFFFRELLYRRAEFVGLVMEEIETWMTDPTLKMVPSREKVTHSVCYAAFAATARLLGSHADEEIVAYRHFLATHATRAAADVASDVNVNVFVQDLIVAYDEGAIDNDCFKVESERMDHPPGSPNQGPWLAHTLYVNFHQALSALGIYLRKGNINMPLRSKDLRDQLSRNDFFLKLDKENNYQISKRFGAAGKQANHSAWGFLVDKHPLGYRQVPDEALQAALLPERDKKLDAIGPVFRESCGDPRKGPLFTIVDGWLAAKEKEKRENS